MLLPNHTDTTANTTTTHDNNNNNINTQNNILLLLLLLLLILTNTTHTTDNTITIPGPPGLSNFTTRTISGIRCSCLPKDFSKCCAWSSTPARISSSRVICQEDCTHTHTHVHIHTHTHTNTYIHTYVHIHTLCRKMSSSREI